MSKTTFKSVNEYIAAQPDAVQEILKRVRSAIRKALPQTLEVISYNIPTYKMGDRPVLYFAAWKKFYSLYPAGSRLVAAFKDDLVTRRVNKSTLRFPLCEAVPVKLIERIAKFRAKEVAAHHPSRRSPLTDSK